MTKVEKERAKEKIIKNLDKKISTLIDLVQTLEEKVDALQKPSAKRSVKK